MIQITPIGQALAPSFDHPIEMLEACHDKVRYFTHQLAQLPAHLDQFGITDATIQTIHGILRYFDVAAPLHHADEEQNLFPALLTVAPQYSPLIERLLAEHLELNMSWLVLREQLQQVQQGHAQALSRTRVQRFCRRYRLHALDEENEVFTAAKDFLSDMRLQELGQPMAARRQSAA